VDTAATSSRPAPPAAGGAPWPGDLLVLVPVYNHDHRVGQVVGAVRALGAPILVIDDGSTDTSATVAAQAGAEVISLGRNHGKAAALRRGLDEAQQRGYQRVLSCDADGQHPSEAVADLARAADADHQAIHIGRRRMRGAPMVSRLGRFLCNGSSWLACGVRLGDTQSGLRVYPVAAVQRLHVPAARYAFEVEVLIRAAWAGLRIHSTPVAVCYPSDRVSHFNKVRDNLGAVAVLLRLVLRRCWPLRRTRLPVDAHAAHRGGSSGGA